MLQMNRKNLLTKEKQKQAYEQKLKNEKEWEFYDGSITEDLESFYDNLSRQVQIRHEFRRRLRKLEKFTKKKTS